VGGLNGKVRRRRLVRQCQCDTIGIAAAGERHAVRATAARERYFIGAITAAGERDSIRATAASKRDFGAITTARSDA